MFILNKLTTTQQIAQTRKLLYQQYGGHTEWTQYQHYWKKVCLILIELLYWLIILVV